MRTIIPLPDYDAPSHYNNEPVRSAYILALRDALRTSLDLDNLHTNWMVGDVAYWIGISGYGGYAFVIFHMVAGVKSGPAWLFALPNTFTGGLVDVDDFFQSASFSSYGRDSNGGTTISTNGNFFFHYCETGGTTDPYSIGYDALGQLTGGDLSVPAVNPFTNLAGFMPPSAKLYGVVPLGFVDTLSHTWNFVMDHDKPFLCMYSVNGLSGYLSGVFLAGEVLEPIRVGDTYKSAMTWWTFSTSVSLGITIASHYIWGYNDTGVRSSYVGYSHSQYKLAHTHWDKIPVGSASFLKGFLDSDIVRTLGPYDALSNAYGSFFKASTLGFPYVEGSPTIP